FAEQTERQTVLHAAVQGDVHTTRQMLAELAEQADLPPRLAHHLALIHHRAAHLYEEHHGAEQAAPYWRLAWRCWLRALEDMRADTRTLPTLLAPLLAP